MIIIAFSRKTSKILPRIICRKFRHVAPMQCRGDKIVMYQFIRPGHIENINMHMRDIKILHAHGWEFIKLNNINMPHGNWWHGAYSCVNMTKRACNIHTVFIQTPDGLYHALNRYQDIGTNHTATKHK